MAFLDNSGDIMIDAILTDEGRKKITQGRFRVVKFALGDEEIDYSMYNLDTETTEEDADILKTPIFEAFEQRNANIHHGLASYGNYDLLYLPVLQLNEIAPTAARKYLKPLEAAIPDGTGGQYLSGSTFYLAANDETADKLRDYFGEESYFLRSNEKVGTKVIVESGLNTSVVQSDGTYETQHFGTRAQRTTYLVEKGLVDRHFFIYCDPRFIKQLYTPDKFAHFRNDRTGAPEVNFSTLQPSAGTSLAPSIEGYQTFITKGVDNLVYYHGTLMDRPTTDVSALRGPRGSVIAFNFEIAPELTTTSDGTRNFKYSVYGEVDRYITNATDKYDIIDTVVSVEGTNSLSMLSLPLRIIRYAGT